MTTGRCTQQCPDSEIYFRIKNNLLHPLECKDPFSVHSNTKNYKQEPDFERICKSYSRSAAAKQIDEEDVRTVDALLDTVGYTMGDSITYTRLLFQIRYLECMEREFDEDKHWDLVYEYMDDRIRAIRQDIIVQNKHTQPESEAIYDAVIRFYLRAMYRCESLKTRCYVSLFHARELNEVMLRWFNGKHANEEVSYNSHTYFIVIGFRFWWCLFVIHWTEMISAKSFGVVKSISQKPQLLWLSIWYQRIQTGTSWSSFNLLPVWMCI